MGRYRKRPVVIEAVQFLGMDQRDPDNPKAKFGEEEVPDWLHKARDRRDVILSGGDLICRTLEGPMTAGPGDWIICGIEGEVYPCKPSIFAGSYEAVDGA